MSDATQGPRDQGSTTKDERRRRPPALDSYGLINNPIIVAVHGRVGDVVYKTYGRKIIITRVPCFDGYVPTAAQRDRRNRMKDATAYAKRIYADPAAKAVYVAAAQTLHRQPFRLAVSDCLKGCPRVEDRAPKVTEDVLAALAASGGAPETGDASDRDWCERRESNPDQWLRRPLHYPLCYARERRDGMKPSHPRRVKPTPHVKSNVASRPSHPQFAGFIHER